MHKCPQALGATQGGSNPKPKSFKSALDAHVGQEEQLPPLVILCLLRGAREVVGLSSAAQAFLSGCPYLMLPSSSGRADFQPGW